MYPPYPYFLCPSKKSLPNFLAIDLIFCDLFLILPDKSLTELIKHYENKESLIMPINADLLMKKYEIPEGKLLGEKLKRIEEEWVKNNFKISDQEVDSIVNG